MPKTKLEEKINQGITDMSWVDGPDSPVHRLPEPARSRFKDTAFETIRFSVMAHDRKWIDHPSGDGFFTLDRTQDDGDLLTVASYLLRPEDRGNRDAVCRVLSDWETSLVPSKDREPEGEGTIRPRFVRKWAQLVPSGSSIVVEALRGQTPVRIFFQAA